MLEIRHLVEIDAAPSTVFRQISTPEGLRAWWTEETSGPDTPGLNDELAFKFGSLYLHRMQVTRHEEGSALTWRCLDGDPEPEWIGTEIKFDLEPVDGRTVLRFEHTSWPVINDRVAGCNQHWSRLLTGLKELCETGAPSPARWGA